MTRADAVPPPRALTRYLLVTALPLQLRAGMPGPGVGDSVGWGGWYNSGPATGTRGRKRQRDDEESSLEEKKMKPKWESENVDFVTEVRKTTGDAVAIDIYHYRLPFPKAV